ncbi:MAG: dienelactone hydrolase family protein [Aquificaceae bacterium]|nr:dienelactone hydrolase family protein [Aquificaceae bacterium]
MVGFSGYFAKSQENLGSVIVIHEWWGLVDHIKDVCDRLAKEGFNAFGIDLYNGKTASDVQTASSLMQELFKNRLAESMESIAEVCNLLKQETKTKIGVMGFCCGGTCTWLAGAKLGDEVSALVPFYGLYSIVDIDFAKIVSPVYAIHAGMDEFVSLEDVNKAIVKCNENSVNARFEIYCGVNHAFFNDSRPEVYNKELAKEVWEKTVEFFKKHLAK